MGFKQGLKKIIPVSLERFQKFNKKIDQQFKDQSKRIDILEESLLAKLEAIDNNQRDILEMSSNSLNEIQDIKTELQMLQDIRGELRNLVKNDNELQLLSSIITEIKTVQESEKRILAETIDARSNSWNAFLSSRESVWADVFHDAIIDSTWLENKTFVPGRWAIGYQYLYVLYRVLNEYRPKRILDLGLGQSTRMIAQYAASDSGVEHIVVEHDESWISFFKNSFQLPENTRILKLDREMVSYKEAEAVRVFKDFEITFKDQKFDLISIDAPLGGDMKQYARIDVLKQLPDCLMSRFVILLDDYNRVGEVNTIREMESVLEASGVKYVKGVYKGQKEMILLCDPNNSFLTSM